MFLILSFQFSYTKWHRKVPSIFYPCSPTFNIFPYLHFHILSLCLSLSLYLPTHHYFIFLNHLRVSCSYDISLYLNTLVFPKTRIFPHLAMVFLTLTWHFYVIYSPCSNFFNCSTTILKAFSLLNRNQSGITYYI